MMRSRLQLHKTGTCRVREFKAESRPSGIHAGNLVREIVAALKSGDKRHQNAVLAFVFEHPADAQRVAQSAEVAALAAVDEQLAAQVKAILAMKKPAV
ncbi:hypothetical protein M3Y99_01641200 [Aphelenchoides fujianensis]|nr:hypothetical protein M3Y99_01641200 [Aphelenchoides fujianensis]